jgi:hypothetical protein
MDDADLISFDDGAMTFPEEELAEAAKASHEMVREAQDAAVWINLCRPLTSFTSARTGGEALVAAERLVAKVINP